MICILGNAPTLVPSSVWASQGCIVWDNKGTCLYVMPSAKTQPQHLVAPCGVLCLCVSAKHAQLQKHRLSHGLARTLVTDDARWAAELRVCETQAAAMEPESAVGCRTLTLSG